VVFTPFPSYPTHLPLLHYVTTGLLTPHAHRTHTYHKTTDTTCCSSLFLHSTTLNTRPTPLTHCTHTHTTHSTTLLFTLTFYLFLTLYFVWPLHRHLTAFVHVPVYDDLLTLNAAKNRMAQQDNKTEQQILPSQ